MKTKETDIAYFEYDNGIVLVKAKGGIVIDKPDMERMLMDAVALTGHEKYYALIDTSNQTDSTAEARNYYSNNEYSKYRYADAYVVTSLAVRLIVNFYLKFNSPPVPSKMFGNIEDAKAWIEELKKNKVTVL